eukprot:SAG11_NODE_33595_length_276_cov_0.875706_1_plen_20_part_10
MVEVSWVPVGTVDTIESTEV